MLALKSLSERETMKTRLSRIATIATLAFTAAICAAQQISVTINDQPVQFREAQPQFVKGRVLVPLRGVFEQMGATVRWNENNQSVLAEKGNRTIRLRIGSRSARVNEQTMNLDVPAMIIDGSTMVPIRFLSESLGAQVGWNENQQLVSIQMNDGGGQNARPERVHNNSYGMFNAGTVIPVSLNTPLSSRTARRGDTFSAQVDSSVGAYANFPRGTRITGHVVAARPRSGNEPGMLELSFDRIRTPEGGSYPIEASLWGLDGRSVDRSNDGTLTGRGESSKSNVYVGIGAGAGLIAGLISHRPLEDAAIGGVLGFLAGEVDKSQTKPKDVYLQKGTQFGVRLDQDLSMSKT